VVLHDIPALADRHHRDLFLQLLQVLPVLDADDPDRVQLPLIVLRARPVHLAHAPLPDLLEEAVF
jgi:hypothetical protein